MMARRRVLLRGAVLSCALVSLLAIVGCTAGLTPGSVPIATFNVVLHPRDPLDEFLIEEVHVKAGGLDRYMKMTIFNPAFQALSVLPADYHVELVLSGASEIKQVEDALAKIRDGINQQIAGSEDPVQKQFLAVDLLAAEARFESFRHGNLPSCSGRLELGKDVTIDIVWTPAAVEGGSPVPGKSPDTGPDGFYSLVCNPPETGGG